jgi:SAM-dependent methyltransferases related to tRNA (uracil-5-)-methyltransferase
MEIKEIRNKWKSSGLENHEAAASFWDSAAAGYENKELPSWQSNEFLRLLAAKVSFPSAKKSLDVGCGAGNYSLALAPKLKAVIGVDLSPAMIEAAQKKAKEHDIKNAEFICADWSLLDIEAIGWQHAFDIVFAHMTPAIDSAAALEKMMACSKKHCFLTKAAKRQDSVLDPLKRQLGLAPGSVFDEHIGEVFELVWRLGGCPEFFYRHDSWAVEHPLEEAFVWYRAKLKTQKKIGSGEEQVIRDYLEKIAVDGRVKEETRTMIVTMYWQV